MAMHQVFNKILGDNVTGPVAIIVASALAFSAGATAANPAFSVDSSAANQVAGVQVVGAATGGTVAIVATDSGSNTNISLNAKGSGTIGIGSVSTGRVTITPVTTIAGALTAAAITASGKLTLTAAVSDAATQALITSTDTSATVLGIYNTTSGGHQWELQSTGSSNSAGRFAWFDRTAGQTRLIIDTSGVVTIPAAVASTSPTDGSLVVGGGLGAGGAINAGLAGTSSHVLNGYLNILNPNSIITCQGTAGYGAFQAVGSGTNSTYMFFMNAGGSTEQARIRADNGGALAFATGASGTDRLSINNSGVVTIVALATGSLTSVSGVITSSSDARMKTRVADFTRSLIDLRNIGPAETYDWNAESGMVGRGSGWMLRDGEGMCIAIPEAVHRGPDGYLSFSDRPVLAACVNAIIEVDDKVERLTRELASTKARLARFEGIQS